MEPALLEETLELLRKELARSDRDYVRSVRDLAEGKVHTPEDLVARDAALAQQLRKMRDAFPSK